jgi:hypothetical protein
LKNTKKRFRNYWRSVIEMPLSERDPKHLEAMAFVESVSRSSKTTSWIWGGYTTDIYMGRMLREHDDIDYLTLNLHRLKSKIAAAFSGHGWQTKDLVNGDLSLKKDNLKVHLGNVEIRDVAKWTHNGEKGFLLFPVSWLSKEIIKFYGMEVHVVAPELQYILKNCPELLNPDWIIREKDVLEKVYLRDILLKKGIDIGSLHEFVNSI